MQYYIFLNNQSIGPISREQIFNYQVTPQTLVSENGQPWKPLGAFPELIAIYNSTRQQYGSQQYGNQQYGNQQYGNQQYGNQQYGSQQYGNQQYGNQQYGNQQYGNQQNCNQQYGNRQVLDSKKVLCGIFAILMGGLGIHYFIMGKVAAGIITILLTIVTFGVWKLVMLIQGILMLCMSDQEFEAKYIYTTKTFPLF